MAVEAAKRRLESSSPPEALNSKKRQHKQQSASLSASLSGEDELCVSCKAVVNTNGIECEWCHHWEHQSCAKLSTNEYKMLDKSSNNIMFFCSQCRSKIMVALNLFDKLQDSLKSIESQLSSMEEKLSNSITKLAKNVENPHIALNDNMDTSISDTQYTTPNQPGSKLTTIVSSVLNEEKEKARRRLNLIVHNAPESTADDGPTRKAHDIKFVSTAFQQYLGVSTKIDKAVRLGKHSGEEQEKPRLLKISVSSEMEKALLLRNCIKLRNKSNPEGIKKLFITPDLTPSELEINKKLRAELKQLNSAKNLYRIKRGKIVLRETESP